MKNIKKGFIFILLLNLASFSLRASSQNILCINSDTAFFQVKILNNRTMNVSDTIHFEFINNTNKEIKLINSFVKYKIYKNDSVICDNGIIAMNLFCENKEVVSKVLCLYKLNRNAVDTLSFKLSNEIKSIDLKKGTKLEFYFEFSAFYFEKTTNKEVIYYLSPLKIEFSI
ncbi:MAG: hypothetical protein V4613_14315 [Bacteroidota bacterium]